MGPIVKTTVMFILLGQIANGGLNLGVLKHERNAHTDDMNVNADQNKSARRLGSQAIAPPLYDYVITNGVVVAGRNVQSDCSDLSACGGTGKYVMWQLATPLTGDFVATSTVSATTVDATALSFVLRRTGGSLFHLGLDGSGNELFSEPPLQLYGQTALTPGVEVTMSITRAGGKITVLFDGVETSLTGVDMPAPNEVEAIGWRPWRNTIAIKSLGLHVPTQVSFVVTTGSCGSSGQCVQSPNYPSDYGNGERCTIAVIGTVPITVEHFFTETYYDKLTVNGQLYSGTVLPVTQVSGTMSWYSDGSVVKKGWQLCAATAPAPAPTTPPTPSTPSPTSASPTPSPTPSPTDSPIDSPTDSPTEVCADGSPTAMSCAFYSSYAGGYFCNLGKTGSVRRRNFGGDAKDNCYATCGYCQYDADATAVEYIADGGLSGHWMWLTSVGVGNTVVGLPMNAGKVVAYDVEAKTVEYNTDGGLSGSAMWHTSVGVGNTVVGLPYNAGKVVAYDVVAKTVEYNTDGGLSGSGMWLTSVGVGNTVVGLPMKAGKVVAYDVEANAVEYNTDGGLSGNYMWRTSVGVGNTVVGLPYRAGKIVVYDVEAKTVEYNTDGGLSGSGGMWATSVGVGNTVVGLPYSAGKVVAYDVEAKTVEYNRDGGLSGNYMWHTSVGVGNTVVGLPQSADKVVVYDVEAKTVEYNTDGGLSGQFWHTSVGVGNTVVGLPMKASKIVVYDVEAKTVEYNYDGGLYGSTMWHTSVGVGNTVVGLPASAGKVVVFQPEIVSPTTAPTLMPPTPAPPTALPPTPTEDVSDSGSYDESPTPLPSVAPTATPTSPPTPSPTDSPTPMPTVAPTTSPTPLPSVAPTATPTSPPTPSPTDSPTPMPTVAPTTAPLGYSKVYDCSPGSFHAPAYTETQTPTIVDCEQLCRAYSDCRYFTYGNSEGFVGIVDGKSYTSDGARANNCMMVSGGGYTKGHKLKCRWNLYKLEALEANLEYHKVHDCTPGLFYGIAYNGIAIAADCAQICRDTVDCQYFAYGNRAGFSAVVDGKVGKSDGYRSSDCMMVTSGDFQPGHTWKCRWNLYKLGKGPGCANCPRRAAAFRGKSDVFV